MDASFDSLVRLVHYAEDVLILMALVMLCSARLMVAMLVLPPTSDQALTGMARNGLPLWVGLYVAYGQPLDFMKELDMLSYSLLILKEGLIGLLLGFAASTVFWVAEGVGSMIDNMAGFNNVQQSNPLSGQQSTPLGNLLSQLSICAFFMLGGLVALVGLVFETYAWWPVRQALPQWGDLLLRFVQKDVADYLGIVTRVAAPALITLVLIDLAFGLLGRVADKLEPNSLAQPVKGAVAMLMIALLVGVFFEQAKPQLALVDVGRTLSAFFEGAAR
ncbi:MAG TPA: type III secretion system export apparatus subunit SctT [Methylibium sp.]|uniref:type III secretion system export apparatus subunit SctT n=1 Tax=Methylibium sp. TaxID=2067992 RepID=UPI002DBAA4A1|nr:type III secretion system export apparatus subunit SctT [Methylibium sp.]HEU4459564.1 type III secretion system export apparatus subunit SctT [Methylibium sp.]